VAWRDPGRDFRDLDGLIRLKYYGSWAPDVGHVRGFDDVNRSGPAARSEEVARGVTRALNDFLLDL